MVDKNEIEIKVEIDLGIIEGNEGSLVRLLKEFGLFEEKVNEKSMIELRDIIFLFVEIIES